MGRYAVVVTGTVDVVATELVEAADDLEARGIVAGRQGELEWSWVGDVGRCRMHVVEVGAMSTEAGGGEET